MTEFSLDSTRKVCKFLILENMLGLGSFEPPKYSVFDICM